MIHCFKHIKYRFNIQEDSLFRNFNVLKVRLDIMQFICQEISSIYLNPLQIYKQISGLEV